MRFVGIDLAWGLRGGTGLCAVADGGVIESTRLTTDAEIVAWLAPHVEGDCLVAIDAPLIVTNPSGRRRCERLISHCFGAQHAGAHSSNRGMTAFADGGRAARLATELGLNVDPEFAPGSAIRRAIEVYPHPALVALFDLPTTLKDKTKAGRTLASRRQAFVELMQRLESLVAGQPPLDVTTSADWARLSEAVGPAGAAELDRLEDELDSYVCAYVALYYWSHGQERCRVVGNLEEGYIVTPVTVRHAECLDTAHVARAMGPAPTSALALFPALHDRHIEVAREIYEQSRLRVADLLVAGILKRSLDLLAALRILVGEANFTAAVPLLRLELDNLLRLNYLHLAEDPDDVSEQILAGTPIHRLRDADGQRLTDVRLRHHARGEYAWVDEVYARTSELIHFSHRNMTNAASPGEGQDERIEIFIGPTREDDWPAAERATFLEVVVVVAGAVLRSAARWAEVKQERAK